jgi:hypothetical protein
MVEIDGAFCGWIDKTGPRGSADRCFAVGKAALEKGDFGMGSKVVVDKQKSSEAVQASARTHKDLAVAGIGAVLGPEAGAAAGVILDKAASMLAETTAAMVKADDAHLKSRPTMRSLFRPAMRRLPRCTAI